MNLLEWGRHLFVPHQSNNHKAKILHPSILTLLVIIFLIYQFGINLFLFLQPAILGFASNITPEKVIELTNQERLKKGLPPLELDQSLNQAAQLKAGDMFAFNYWAHNSPSGRSPWDFFEEAGYRYLYAGENLARDFMTSEAVVKAWMNSPTHKENILNGKYEDIGLAVVDGTLNGVETTLVVQLFATPSPGPGLAGGPKIVEAAATVSAGTVTPKAILNPFTLTKSVSVFLLGLLFGVFLIDVVLVYRKRVVRLSGRNLAHTAFVGILLLLAFLTQQGAIL